MGKYISGGYTLFYDGVKPSDLGSRSNVLKYLYGRIIFSPFEEKIHEGTIWRGHGEVISSILTRQIFPHFYRHGDRFYNWYINKIDKNIILITMVMGWNQKISYKEEHDTHLVVIQYKNFGIDKGKYQKTILVEKGNQLDLFIFLS